MELTLKMAAAVFAETLGDIQHFMRRILDKPN
jgi:hypothetical protein